MSENKQYSADIEREVKLDDMIIMSDKIEEIRR